MRAVRKPDLERRKQAAAGDAQAAIELGRLYLLGARGMAPNAKLALAYLAPHLERHPQLRDEVARVAPLEVLVTRGQRGILAVSAETGEPDAIRKMVLWCAFLGDPCGWHWLDRLGEQDSLQALLADARLGDAATLADLLLPLSTNCDLLRLLLNACLAVIPASESVRRALLSAICDAEAGRDALEPLEPGRLAGWLSSARQGSGYVDFIHGCALLGQPCGRIEPQQLAPKKNFRLGYARLLRAAHGGHGPAWWMLYRACSDYRSVVANREAARFFLERAADCGVVQAQQTIATLQARRAAASLRLVGLRAAA
jgi:hypothetical protein